MKVGGMHNRGGPGQGGRTVRMQTMRQVASAAASRLRYGTGHAHTCGPGTPHSPSGRQAGAL